MTHVTSQCITVILKHQRTDRYTKNVIPRELLVPVTVPVQFRDVIRSRHAEDTGNERESKHGDGARTFEKLINLFWCQNLD